MEENLAVREKLLLAAREEFLSLGYQKASLRNIANQANVTTGAIYFFFGSKEGLFHAVVDETADLLRQVLIRGAENEYTGKSSGEENDRAFILALHQHPEEALILLEKTEGSPMAGFRAEMTGLLCDGFMRFFLRAGGKEADAALVQLLVEQRVHAILSLIAHRFDLEKTLAYVVLIGAYGDAGFQGMMQKYHQMKNSSAE